MSGEHYIRVAYSFPFEKIFSCFSTTQLPDANFLFSLKDDIEIEDPGEKQKGNPMVAALNKQNLTNTFQALKGKLY